jgi:hypothetical protein
MELHPVPVHHQFDFEETNSQHRRLYNIITFLGGGSERRRNGFTAMLFVYMYHTQLRLCKAE